MTSKDCANLKKFARGEPGDKGGQNWKEVKWDSFFRVFNGVMLRFTEGSSVTVRDRPPNVLGSE